MSAPSEDLVVIAKMLDANAPAMLLGKVEWPERPSNDWRDYIPEPLRKVWGRVALEGRLSAYVVAETMARSVDDAK